jgi:hypothetical protein
MAASSTNPRKLLAHTSSRVGTAYRKRGVHSRRDRMRQKGRYQVR